MVGNCGITRLRVDVLELQRKTLMHCKFAIRLNLHSAGNDSCITVS